jgi:DNA polymerase-3 subunit delta'
MSVLFWHEEQFRQLAQRAGALPHAVLLTGQAGIGKRVFGKVLAQGMLCEQPHSALNACGTCAACRWFESGNHPDFRLLQPETAEASDDAEPDEKKKKRDISVAQVRSLSDFINFSAHRSGSKVILIAPAESMNVNAANALLKSLEEPPPATYFILVSDRPHMLPATIRSRCQNIALRPPTVAEAPRWLNDSGISNPELLLAQAGGAPLLALELDTPEYWSSRRKLLDGLCARDFDPLALAVQLMDQPVSQIINWLQRWTYDLSRIIYGQQLRYNPDQYNALTTIAKRMKELDILRFHRELVRFQRVVNHPLNPRLLIEDLMLRYAQLLRD